MHFISTSGHGYLRISLNQFFKARARGFIPSSYSYINTKCVLLEEDCDATEYLKKYNPKKWVERDKIRVVYQNDINRNRYYHTSTSSFQDIIDTVNYNDIYNK